MDSMVAGVQWSCVQVPCTSRLAEPALLQLSSQMHSSCLLSPHLGYPWPPPTVLLLAPPYSPPGGSSPGTGLSQSTVQHTGQPLGRARTLALGNGTVCWGCPAHPSSQAEGGPSLGTSILVCLAPGPHFPYLGVEADHLAASQPWILGGARPGVG